MLINSFPPFFAEFREVTHEQLLWAALSGDQTTHTEKGESFPGPRRVRSELSGQGLQEPFEPEEP